jgi:glycosyltransferase involved in cell wall biosynthesis
VGRVERIPTIYEMRGMWEESHAIRHQTSEKSLQYRIIHFLEGIAFRRADICCVIGEGLKQEVLRRGIHRDRIVIVPNGVDTRTFVPGPRDPKLAEHWGLRDAVVMGYIGSFSRYERLDLLVEAMIALSPEFPDLRLLLVGDGDLMPALRRMALEAGISDRVIFTGRLSHEQIPDFYRLCSFLVLPRSDTGKTQLITPLKPLEIMAMGKALIASDIPGHREMIQDGLNGVFFKAGDARELASVCREFGKDNGLVADLGARAREWVEANRDWEVLVSRYVDLYERMIHRNVPELKQG